MKRLAVNKEALTATFSALSLLVVAGMQLVSLGRVNSFVDYRTVPPSFIATISVNEPFSYVSNIKGGCG
jgi:hypothetical protein